MIAEPARSRGSQTLSLIALGMAVIATVYAAVTIVPGSEIFASDPIILGLFGLPLVLIVLSVFVRIGRSGVGRRRVGGRSERWVADLPSTWIRAWPPAMLRVLQIGFPIAVLAIAVSLFRLRHGGPAIEDGRYYLFNHGPVHPISRKAWVSLRNDEQRLFMTGAAMLCTVAAGLLRIPWRPSASETGNDG